MDQAEDIYSGQEVAVSQLLVMSQGLSNYALRQIKGSRERILYNTPC